jgi:colicin import membrane protein
MKTLLKSVVLVALALAVAAPLSAGEGEKKAEGKKPAAKKADGAKKAAAKKAAGKKRAPGAQAVNALLKRLSAAELSDEQVAKIKEIAAEYAPKLVEARQKQGLSKEQQAAMKEARAKAKADGLKGKAAAEAVAKAVNLSDDQKAAQAAVRELSAALNKAALAVLTDEQRAKIAPKRAANKGAKKPGAKKAAKKAEADK